MIVYRADHLGAAGPRLFALPPRSPKLNGRVTLRTAQRNWEQTYNYVRPYQTLG
jgi:hypothetical protein